MPIDQANTFAKIKSIVAEQLGIAQDCIEQDSTLESLGADSLDRFEIIIKIEEEFSIAIDDDTADNISTLQQAVDYVQKLANK